MPQVGAPDLVLTRVGNRPSFIAAYPPATFHPAASRNEGRKPTLLHCGHRFALRPGSPSAQRGSETDPPSLRHRGYSEVPRGRCQRGSETDPPSLRPSGEEGRTSGRVPTRVGNRPSFIAAGGRRKGVDEGNPQRGSETDPPSLRHEGRGWAGISLTNEGRKPTLLHCGVLLYLRYRRGRPERGSETDPPSLRRFGT